MGRRGPKSAVEQANEAGLKVIDGDFSGRRPDAPERLTSEQTAIWNLIINGEPVDKFATAETQNMLADLCVARASLDTVYSTINDFEASWLKSAKGLKRYAEMMDVANKLVGRCINISRSLRLTNQSRYTPHTAGRQ